MTETKHLLKQAIAKCDSYLAVMEGETNPQIKAEFAKAKAERDAFQAVLESLNKSHMLLRTYT